MFSLLLLSPYGRHYRRSNMHFFSNNTDLAARLFSHFPNVTSDHRYGTHSFLYFPSHLVSQQHIAQGIFRRQMFSTWPSSCLTLSASLKRKKLLRCHMEMIPWTPEFVTSVAGRGGTLRVMIRGGECACFDTVVLNAYKECPAQDQEDKRRYLRRRHHRRFLVSTCPPVHLKGLALQNVFKTTSLQSSVFPLSLYEEDFNVYSPGLDLKTVNAVEER